MVFVICEVKMRSPRAVSIHGKCTSLLPLKQGAARNKYICYRIAGNILSEDLGGEESRALSGCHRSPSTYLHNWALKLSYDASLKQLSSDTKGGFHAVWCCVCLPSLPGLPVYTISIAPAPDFSECLVQGGERELCWGRRFSLPPSLTSSEWFSWCCHGNGACSLQKRECVWHSAAARCGEERACILPSPSSHCGERCRI